MSRYRIEGNWEMVDQQHLFNYEQEKASTVIWESCTLHDENGGWTYPEGAHRVRIVSTLANKPRTKTFKGELAWANAQRYFGDCLNKLEKEG